MTDELLRNYWSRREFAEQIRRHERTIQRWVRIGDHPPITYIGNEPYFRKDAAVAWLLAREKAPVRKTGKRRPA